MKKILLFLPAALALAAYLLLGCVSGFGAISPAVWLAIGLLAVSAYVMYHGKWYGCIGGVMVGCVLITMSTQYTGQVIDVEKPLGILLFFYFLGWGMETYKKAKG